MLTWDIRASSLILIVGLIGRQEWWFPQGTSIDGILSVMIFHGVMAFVIYFVRSNDRGYTKAADIEMCHGVHSGVGDSGKVWVLL